MNGIIYKDHVFSEPVAFGSTLPSKAQGVFAILVQDMYCSPRPFRAIFFGETANLGKAVSSKNAKYDEWQREAAGSPLYVSFLNTGKMTPKQRKVVESELVAEYEPACNQTESHSVA